MQPKKRSSKPSGGGKAFATGRMVIVSLANPREKYWGELLDMSAAGVSVRAIALDSFDDFVAQVRAAEPVNAAVLFFPMHRVERVEVDARTGEVESLAERFAGKAGIAAKVAFSGGAPRR